MGGHAAGEVASKIVIGVMERLDEDRAVTDLMGELRATVVEANQRIADAVAKSKDLEGMGTTLTALRFNGAQVGLAHVGDSRAYLLRGDLLSQITHDDTYVQYLVDSGKLTPDEAKEHPRKSVILRALLGSEVEPDVSIREARAGDRYLLCTDGLSDVVSTDTLAETLRIPDPQEAADRLVELALRGGGPDNVTVIVADVLEGGAGERGDDVPVVAGAFVDPAGADVPGSDSAAERAARIGRAVTESAPVPQRSWWARWRLAVILGAVVVLVVGGIAGAYAFTQTYYFVGKDGSEVAIFRGVNTQFGPLKFFNVYKNTDLEMLDLQPSVRSQVADGIDASSERDAEQIVANLHNNILPLCAVVNAPQTVTPTPTPTKSTSSSASRKRTTGTRTPSRTPSATPTPTPSVSTPSPTLSPPDGCRS
jgi:protein phosphatase